MANTMPIFFTLHKSNKCKKILISYHKLYFKYYTFLVVKQKINSIFA